MSKQQVSYKIIYYSSSDDVAPDEVSALPDDPDEELPDEDEFDDELDDDSDEDDPDVPPEAPVPDELPFPDDGDLDDSLPELSEAGFFVSAGFFVGVVVGFAVGDADGDADGLGEGVAFELSLEACDESQYDLGCVPSTKYPFTEEHVLVASIPDCSQTSASTTLLGFASSFLSSFL